MSVEEQQRNAVVACAEMKETLEIQGAARVKLVNEVREKIGGEPYTLGDEEIKRSIRWGTCEQLVLNDPTYNTLTDSIEEQYHAEQERLAKEQKAERLRLEKEQEAALKAEFQAKEGKLKEEAQNLRMKFAAKGLSLVMGGLSGGGYERASDETKIKSYAQVFVEEAGLSQSDAISIAGLAYMRQEVDRQKNDGMTNRFGRCVDKVIPDAATIFFTTVARKYKSGDYSDLLALTWEECS